MNQTAGSCIYCGVDVYCLPGEYPVCKRCKGNGSGHEEIDWEELEQAQGYEHGIDAVTSNSNKDRT